ncbi:hypothetical protein [Bacillus sp. FJAT-27231]|uniref:hypothetical protein n=1 Tax=Bacillus sp. FJAT-27231 TaxID=1679168 RepID=UPI0012E10A6F|nr:hypothetical protein [Bacillus sp. FJAT-27231]
MDFQLLLAISQHLIASLFVFPLSHAKPSSPYAAEQAPSAFLYLSSFASLPLEAISRSGCVAEERHFAILSYACRGSTVGYAFLFCPAAAASG